MLRGFPGRLMSPGSRPRPRRRRRLTGCLLWIVGLVIVLVILSLLFGGFQKGTRVGGTGAPVPFSFSAVS